MQLEHPIAVAEILVSVGIDDEAILVAALCHDVVEDTPTSIEEIEAEFGAEVAELVGWLTDVSRPSDGNRQMRKQVDLEHTAAAPAAAKTIKLADLIDNTLTIEAHGPHFWRVYRREKIRLLAVLKEGDQTLWAQAAGLRLASGGGIPGAGVSACQRAAVRSRGGPGAAR